MSDEIKDEDVYLPPLEASMSFTVKMSDEQIDAIYRAFGLEPPVRLDAEPFWEEWPDTINA